MAYVYDYTALTTGLWRWNISDPVGTPTVVTYSFLDNNELPDFYESPPAVGGAWNNYYVTLTASQRAATRVALGEYEANSGLRFVEVSDPSQASLQFHGNRSDHLTSWAYYPITPDIGGDVSTESSFVTLTYDPSLSWTSDVSRGGALFTVILHELGHAVGLQHSHEGVILAPSLDTHDNTIMSYNWDWEGDATGRARDTLARFDIEAIKYLYGDSAGYSVSWRPGGQFLLIDGGEGNDRVVTGRAASFMLGGAGNDWLSGRQFNDTLQGGDGSDRLDGGAGNDRVAGEIGNDLLLGGLGDDAIWGGLGDDRLQGEYGDDRLVGDDGHDTILGGEGFNWLAGGAGNDRVLGGNSADTLLGATGDDDLRGGGGDDRVAGGDGNDTLDGGSHADWLAGQNGADRLFGRHGNDALYGEADRDQLWGDSGNDRLNGGAGPDSLFGGVGHDWLFGGDGHDLLRGDAGRDQLVGGVGFDFLGGGADADVFVFTGRIDVDRIMDWQNGLDRISLAGRAGYDSFDDVAAVTVQWGVNVLIRLDATSSVVIANTSLSAMDASDFIF